MRLEQLKELYDQCKTLPNYHYKDLTEDEVLSKAVASFNKLPPAQSDKVEQSWARALG